MSRSSKPAAARLQKLAVLRGPLFWLPLLLTGSSAQIPYNPTTILHNGSLLYVFQPASGSASQFELGSVDISSKVAAASLPYTILFPTLPFLRQEEQRPFNAILDHGGNITVYTGDCALGAGGAEAWTFTPQPSSHAGNGTWSHQEVTFAQDGKHVFDIGPTFLSGGLSFSSLVNGSAVNTDAYFFGGMCPFQNRSNDDWQSAANYSNTMVTLEPSQAGAGALRYQLGLSSSRGPPIPEAGFTMTGLLPTFSGRGDGAQTQQQNFVLMGGHTSSAFINTSQVALFSLPEKGWTFVPVSQPDTTRTDLAIRTDIITIEPRSGHSAVLTPDGQRIIVFGGWIGDIDTPAEPQLAVLNVGDSYGGQGDWVWTVPSASGSALSSGSGIYGHGAAMLPGGVMMIMGGYSIPASASRWRRATRTSNSKTLFFNISSNTWISEYSPPRDSTSAQPIKTGPLSTPGQKAGLGVGLGIGMAVVLSLMCFYLWYTRRLKKQRDLREKQLQELAMGAHRYNLDCPSPGLDVHDGHIDYPGNQNDSYFYPTIDHPQTQGWRRANVHEAERTGLLVEIPSPTRGLRRSLSGRANHGMARCDDRRVRGSGHIHPIDELDEGQEQDAEVGCSTPGPDSMQNSQTESMQKLLSTDYASSTSQPEMTERSTNRSTFILNNAPSLDLFTDSDREQGLYSAPTSPHREDSKESSASCSAAGSIQLRQCSPSPDGRASPTKSSERTGSNLSERSTRSNLSHTTNASFGSNSSLRFTALRNNAAHANPFKTPDASPTTETSDRTSNGWHTPTDLRAGSSASNRGGGRPSTANTDTDRFMSAHSSFMQLQAEGEALLGGNPERARPGTSTSNGSSPHSYRETEGSVSRAGTVTAATSFTEGYSRAVNGRERRKSWLGSVRKALTRSASSTSRTRSLTAATHQFEAYTDNPSPVRQPSTAGNRTSFQASCPPRRAASEASFWKSKRGKQDWLDDEVDPNDPGTKWRRNSGDDWGAPEDLFLAEKERQRREWRERGNLLINLADQDQLPTPRTPIRPGELGVPNDTDRPCTPADELDWDVEAAVERRVVQVMFTVPKSKLRVVNADVDRSSLLSVPRDKESDDKTESAGQSNSSSPARVKDLAWKFEQMNPPRQTPHASPKISPSPGPSPSLSGKSFKIRAKGSSTSLGTLRNTSSPSIASRSKENEE